jgi:hypothetical protein
MWQHEFFAMDRRQKNYIVLILIASLAMTVFLLVFNESEIRIEDGILQRPAYDQQPAELEINVYEEGKEVPITTKIKLSPERYSAEEISSVFEELYDKVLVDMKGSNDSLDEISQNLNLVTQVPGYSGTMEWYSEDYDLIDYNGTVYNENFKEKESRKTELTLELEYADYRCEYVIGVTVVPRVISSEAAAARRIQLALQQAAQNSTEEKEIELPEQIDGNHVKYAYQNETTSPFVAIGFGILAMAAVVVGSEKEKQNTRKKRLGQLQNSYPEVISKLTLLVGAGMTVRRAWGKIVLDYQNQKERAHTDKTKWSKILAYEEMTETYNQMNAGIPEVAAYELFGRKCNTKEYLKLSALLEQNIKKGTKDLITLLEQETSYAFEERKNIAKRHGEEAGTRLLLPMVIMLVIVMIIVMVPAAMSFQI